MGSKKVTVRSTKITKDADGREVSRKVSEWDAVQYDPSDPNDPLRHNYLARKPESATTIPIEQKIANGLGVTEVTRVELVVPDGGSVHAEQVPLGFRKRLARTLGIGA